MLISLVETRLLKEKEIRIPCYSQIFRNDRSGDDGGIIVGQTLSNVCFVKVSIVWISVEWLWILKLGKNFWEKERGFFLCFNNDRVSLNCSKSNLVFYCKEMHNSVICDGKNDSRGKTATIDSSTNYASSFPSILLPTAYIPLEKLLNKQEVCVTILFDQGSQRTYMTQKWKIFCSWRWYAQKEFLFPSLEARNVSLKIWKRFLCIWKTLIKNLRSKHFALHLFVYQFRNSPAIFLRKTLIT